MLCRWFWRRRWRHYRRLDSKALRSAQDFESSGHHPSFLSLFSSENNPRSLTRPTLSFLLRLLHRLAGRMNSNLTPRSALQGRQDPAAKLRSIVENDRFRQSSLAIRSSTRRARNPPGVVSDVDPGGRLHAGMSCHRSRFNLPIAPMLFKSVLGSVSSFSPTKTFTRSRRHVILGNFSFRSISSSIRVLDDLARNQLNRSHTATSLMGSI